jgi:hypothetical protein
LEEKGRNGKKKLKPKKTQSGSVVNQELAGGKERNKERKRKRK